MRLDHGQMILAGEHGEPPPHRRMALTGRWDIKRQQKGGKWHCGQSWAELGLVTVGPGGLSLGEGQTIALGQKGVPSAVRGDTASLL